MLFFHRRSSYLFIAVIILVPFLLFWRWLLKGEVLYWGTLLLQFWPWHELVKQSLLAGRWPLWNPFLGNGTPLLANLQAGVFYPLNLLYLFLPVEQGLTLSVLLHLVLAGLFTYCYARYLELSPFAATISALVYMLSGYLVGRTQFVTMVNAAAWLPLLLLLSERLAARPTALTGGGLGLALAMPLLAGHAQLWFYSLWLVAAYILFRSGQQVVRKLPESGYRWQDLAWRFGRTLGPAAAYLAGVIGLALLLAAVQLLPTAELTLQSPRSSGAERNFALTYSFWPWRLITLLAPDFFGSPAAGNYWGYANYWEDHAYLGVLPILLTLVAIGRYYRRARPASAGRYWTVVPFFVVLALLSLVLAMGWNTPVYMWVFNIIPGFAFFQAPARLLIWYTIAITMLAGIGAHVFELTPAARRFWQRLLVASGGITVAAGTASLMLTGRSRTFLVAGLALGILLAISIILLLNRPATGSSRAVHWQWVVILFTTLDLLWAALPLVPTLPPAIFSRTIASAGFLKAQPGSYRFVVDDRFDYDTKFQQYFRFDTFGPANLAYWQTLKETLIPNLGVYAGLPAANNYDPLVVGHWDSLMTLIKNSDDNQAARLLPLLNVGYLISGPGRSTDTTIYANDSLAIQHVAQPLPRAYFVPQGHAVKNEAQAIARLTSPDFDSLQEAVIMLTDTQTPNQLSQGPVVLSSRPGKQSGDFELNQVPTAAVARGSAEVQPATITAEDTDRIVLMIDAPAAGLVVLTDTFYPGWQATVDAGPVPIWQANLAFRAVPVEAGRHEIVFSYQPDSFKLGLWISAAAWLVVILVGGAALKSRLARNRTVL